MGQGFAILEEESIVERNNDENDGTPMLTSVADAIYLQDTPISIDVNNEITGDDENISYLCVYDMIVDGNVPMAFPCTGLAGSEELNIQRRVRSVNMGAR